MLLVYLFVLEHFVEVLRSIMSIETSVSRGAEAMSKLVGGNDGKISS